MLAAFTIGIVFVATFLLASIAVVIAWMILERRNEEASAGQDPGPGSSGLEGGLTLLKSDDLSSVSLWAGLLRQFDFVEGLKKSIAEAGLTWSVGRLTAMMLLAASVILAAGLNLSWLPAWAGLGLAGAGGLAPYFYVMRLRAARLFKFEEQLPEALDFLSRALRAGHPFAASLEMLAAESSPPLSVEMRKTHDERGLGVGWERALANLAHRVPLIDVRFFAAAVLLQSRAGGKLGEVLSRLSETIRERFALRGEIRAIATHGRLTGLVLTIIPLVVAGVMLAVNPAYLQILVTHPKGRMLITASVVCLCLAHVVIRKIVQVKL